MKALVLSLLLISPFFCRANSYDDDEQIRRAVQKLVDQDKQERDAAKQRADVAESRSNGNGGGGVGGLLCLGFFFGLPALLIWNKYYSKSFGSSATPLKNNSYSAARTAVWNWRSSATPLKNNSYSTYQPPNIEQARTSEAPESITWNRLLPKPKRNRMQNKDTSPFAPFGEHTFGEHTFTQNGFCKKCGWERNSLVTIGRKKCLVMKRFKVQFTSDKKPQNYIQKAYGFTLKNEKYYFHKMEDKSDFKTFVFAKNVVSIDELESN